MIPLEFRKKQDIERLPAIMKCLAQFDLSGARDRNRTGTSLSGPGILSPVRLPVSPPGLYVEVLDYTAYFKPIPSSLKTTNVELCKKV